MQVRAYNFWAGLLGNRAFPDVSALEPDRLQDFGPFSVLLDFTGGIENPAIAYLGSRLAEECDAPGTIRRLNDVPSRSLLSRITDHYMQILANQAPIGFEAEFVNQRGATILYRGILLPFSRDDVTIDSIYGVINWKERDDHPAASAPLVEAEARPAMLRESIPMSGWADGPVDLDFGRPALGHKPLELPFAAFGLPGEDLFAEVSLPGEGAPMSLADWLAAAREQAFAARSSEDRSRQALYEAIGRAYDFALAAAEAPAQFAELVEDAGLKTQDRAPLIPLVKLVFGADYDKTRLTEFATAIAHGQRRGVARGGLTALLAEAPGGLKAIVQEERRMRRTSRGEHRSGRDALVEGLRRLDPLPLDAVGHGGEFTVIVARRLADGQLVLLGEVADDEALLGRAARHLLD